MQQLDSTACLGDPTEQQEGLHGTEYERSHRAEAAENRRQKADNYHRGVIVAVLLAAYVGLCAYANSLDIFYPNTTINGVDVAGLTAEQAAERLRQEIPEETVEFYLPLADETGDGESAPEGDMLYGADPDAVCTYRELGITEELDYEVSAQSAFDAVQGRSSFFVKGWEYLACLVGADGQLGVVLEPEEDIFQVKMEQLSEQFSREAQDASYEVTEDAVEITSGG